jgi:hypothetical protein
MFTMAQRIPPSINVPRYGFSTSSHSFADHSHNSPNASRTFRSSQPMAIANSIREPSPPPPLPPPTYNHDLAAGRDIGWIRANRGIKREPLSRPVSPGANTWDRQDPYRPPQFESTEYRRRKSSTSTVTSVRSPLSTTTDTFEVPFRDEGHVTGLPSLNPPSQSVFTYPLPPFFLVALSCDALASLGIIVQREVTTCQW